VQASRMASSHNTSGTSRREVVTSDTTTRTENSTFTDDVTAVDDDQPVESMVDQIAKQFPGARIVDTSQN